MLHILGVDRHLPLNSFRLILISSLLCLSTKSLKAQCNCPPIDSSEIAIKSRSIECVDQYFEKWYTIASTTGNAKRRLRYLRKSFLLKPNHPGLLERYVEEADQKRLREIRDVLKCLLANEDQLLNDDIVRYNLALAHAQYRLGAYGDGYQDLVTGITRDVFCRIDHNTTKATICNNMAVLQLLYQGTNDMHRSPVKPLSRHDITVSIGMLDSALSFLPGDTTIEANIGRLPDLDQTPFNRYLCTRKPIRTDQDTIDTFNKMDSIRKAKYCRIGLFNARYDSLYRYIDEFDEVIFLHDLSGSMDTITENTRGMRRIDLANELLSCMTYDLAHKDLGMVSVGNFCGTAPQHKYAVTEYDTTVFRQEVGCCDVFGATPLRERLQNIDSLFVDQNSKRLIFLLTDGMDNCISPFDLCELSQLLFDKGIYLSILHLLPDEEQYDRIKDIYHCMTNASRSNVYKLNETGDIELEPPRVPEMPYLRIGDVQECSNDEDSEFKCRKGIVAWVKPDSERWSKGNTWGKGARDSYAGVDCRIPRIPWQCKVRSIFSRSD